MYFLFVKTCNDMALTAGRRGGGVEVGSGLVLAVLGGAICLDGELNVDRPRRPGLAAACIACLWIGET